MNLHELRRIKRKTGKDELWDGKKADVKRKKHFLPTPTIGTANRFNIVFIDEGILLAEIRGRFTGIIIDTDLTLV